MDPERFDRLTLDLITTGSRRSAVAALLGAALAGPLALLEFAAAGNRKRKRRKKRKKRGCPEDSFACPDGTCVPKSSLGNTGPTCCHGEPCGECGVCVNGRCVEVPGICDTANCQRCSRVHWGCESSCAAEGDCCHGVCCNAGETCADGACRDGCYFCGTLPVCCKTDDGTVYGCCARGQTCIYPDRCD